MSTELLKEGTKIFQGVDSIIKNIDAVKELSKITRTSLGPNGSVLLLNFKFNIIGMNKMVVNRIGKLFVTNDAATILKELEIMHPAAKICVHATDQQEQEVPLARSSLPPLDQPSGKHPPFSSHAQFFVKRSHFRALPAPSFHSSPRGPALAHSSFQFGDATNFVLVLAGELLTQAQTLLRMGLHASDVIRGFEKVSLLLLSKAQSD